MIIKIGTDKFWVKASNIERWAEILKSLPVHMTATSKKDIAKDYLGYMVDKGGRIVNADEVYGMFGIEKSKSSVAITGCNFIKEVKDGYELTEGAIELVDRYKKNDSWEKALACQLLKYSLRVRTVVYAMINGGYLTFDNGYMKNFIKSYITFNDNKYYIFSKNPDETNINQLIHENSAQILGSFWRKELNIESTEEIVFKGINKEELSLKGISTFLGIPILLFDYLGWIIEDEDGKYILDKHRIIEDVGNEVYESFIDGDETDDIEILHQLIKEHSDARGYFSIEIIGSKLKDKIDSENSMILEQWIDHYFVTGINKGIFKIKDHEQGQPRHGRGLLGKKDYQLIKLEIKY